MALNTGRSGQPVQKLGGRAGNSSPIRDAPSARWATRSSANRRISSASTPAGFTAAQNFANPSNSASVRYSPAMGRQSLPYSLVCKSALRRIRPICCSMNSGLPSSITSMAFFPAQNVSISLGASGWVTFSTSCGTSASPNASARPQLCNMRWTVL